MLCFLTCCSCDPAEELREMEEIMMKSFPFDMMLNTRIGPDALAHRVAKVLGYKYVPSERNSIGSGSKVKPSREGKIIVDEDKLLGIIDASLSKALASRVELVLNSKQTNQRENYKVNIEDVSKSKLDNKGQKCVEKLEIVEETRYDDELTCDHSYDRRCHTTYVTKYVAYEHEVCEENYKRECVINFEKVAFNVTVTVCRQPLVKDCDVDGVEVCRTESESECTTVHEHNQVEDDVPNCQTIYEELCLDQTNGYTTTELCDVWPKEVCEVTKRKNRKVKPITSCRLVPRELCAPASCRVKEGEEECFDQIVTTIEEKPKETCTFDPQRSCKFVTELVPQLEPVEECVDVPKEVCSRAKMKARKVKKPVVKKWCYIPTKETGLKLV